MIRGGEEAKRVGEVLISVRQSREQLVCGGVSVRSVEGKTFQSFSRGGGHSGCEAFQN